MLKNIAIGQHYPIDSFIHELDPRVKILVSILYIVTLFVVNNFLGYIAVILFVALIIIASKVPFMYVLKGLKPILLIIIITFFINLFLTPGETLYKFWIFKISKEGLHQASFMAIRLIFLIIGTSILTLTTSPILLTDGIESLLNPFKRIGLPAHELAMMMTIALRFIPTLMEETEKIMKAQKARGADFESGNIMKRAKNLVPLLVPLFISAFRRADDLAMAMEARCYRGGENRTRMRVLRLRKGDYVAISVFVVYTVAIIVLKYV